ncbi:MAG: helix-turn-helix transcriptional regulator [Dehalococcoidia bacterium]
MEEKFAKTERLIKIWLLLSTNPAGYTVKELARCFGVNIRTIYRDMMALGTDLNVPVYDDKGRWRMDESHMLPPVRFTLSEALNIFLAARLMLRYSQRYDPNVDATFTKLSSVLPPALAHQVRKTMDWMQQLPKNERSLRILTTVAEAWVTQRRLKIAYRSLLAEEPVERIIEPYYVEPAAPEHDSYVIGYCQLRKEIRTFKMTRIEVAELTSEPYTIPPDFDASKFFGSSWRVMVGGEAKRIKLKVVDPEIMRIMEETVWHPSQVLEMHKDGSMVMTLKVSPTVDFYSWILGWGEKIEVLEPKEVREVVMSTAKKMVKVYDAKWGF